MNPRVLTAVVESHYVRDPVHGFIPIPETGILSDLIDTVEFQRLRYIRQLGVSYNIYPGAEHSRFFHSLGVAHLAGRMHEAILRSEGRSSEEREQIHAERLRIQVAALLHDIGHPPFSHVFDQFWTPDTDHVAWGGRILMSGETEVGEILRKHGFPPSEIGALIGGSPSKPKYLHMLISSQMDADRFDYLLRDAYHTGNPCGNYDLERILRTIALKDDIVHVKEKGKFSMEGYLMGRYHMYNQVYLHRTTLCFEFLLKTIIRRAYDLQDRGLDSAAPPMIGWPAQGKTRVSLSPADYLSMTDDKILSFVRECMKSSDNTLKDLSTRYFCRRHPFKPIKDRKVDPQSMTEVRERAQNVLLAHHMDPDYYLLIEEKVAKPAYYPYDPQKDDPENAIFLEDGREISDVLPSLNALKIGGAMLICVPEEVRSEIAEAIV